MELIYITDRETNIKYYIKSMISINKTENTSITEYNTTEGTNISDHAYIEPNSVTIQFSVSELNKQSNNIYYEGSANNVISLDLVTAQNLIDNWNKNHTRLLIQTRLNQYNNMVITSVSTTEDNNNRGVYAPTITLKECRVANIYTQILGPFAGSEVKPTYTQEYNMGSSNGASWEGTLGSIAAGAVIGGTIFGPWGAVIGGAIGAFGNWVGWW